MLDSGCGQSDLQRLAANWLFWLAIGLPSVKSSNPNSSDEESNQNFIWVVVIFVIVFAVYKVVADASLPTAVALHILVESESECQRLKAELSKEEDVLSKFQEFAKQHSSCPSGRNGGSLGKFKQGAMDPVFDRAVFTTGVVGEVTGPVRTAFGYHLIYIVRRDDKKAA